MGRAAIRGARAGARAGVKAAKEREKAKKKAMRKENRRRRRRDLDREPENILNNRVYKEGQALEGSGANMVLRKLGGRVKKKNIYNSGN